MRYIRLLLLFSAVVLLSSAIGNTSPAPSPQKTKKNKAQTETSERAAYWKKWLNEDVIYIISDEEKNVFKNLQTDEEREKFVEQFWARRNPDPRNPDNSFKEEHYRRIAYANERFASGIPGWKTDRGRIYIMYGKADEVESHPSGGTYNREIWEGGGTTSTFPFERWRYRHIDGIGDDIEIEFVDASMSGEYKIAMSPDEKDALMFVPGAGLTMNEELGLSKKEDRPFFNPGAANDPSQNSYMRAKDMPFARMEQYFNLQRPPQIKFADLKSVVSTNVTFNQLAYDMRADFIRLSSDKVLVPITIELQNKDLQFKKELDFNRAAVNVYGIVTGLTGRIMAEFEDVITQEYTDPFFDQGKAQRSEYQKIVGLPPGQRFKLDLVLKDINSGYVGHLERGIVVPKYDSETLQCSSIILANRVDPIANNTDQLAQYVIGDLKILPNVRSEYYPGQFLIPYLQIYNAQIDQTSLKPSLEVTYTVKSGGKVVEDFKDNAGDSIQFFSGQRVVVLGKIQVKGLAPGKYSLDINVLDKIANKSVTAATDFKVKEPVAPAAATAQK
ncbi:MAG TPA: GWxTD domain-containing protein [Acidobacteriota bacterium]|nr:GWxTD domain-containing protein [Acidobacteriota bacterium]